MDRSLWLLMELRFLGWLRRMKKGFSTVKGILISVIGVVFFAGMILPNLIIVPAPTPEYLETIRRLGPAAFLGMCLANLLLSSGERAIPFTPAEVNFLFPAPLSRRQLLLYKIAGTLALSLFMGLMLSLGLRQHTAGILPGLIGITLATMFLQLFAIALSLLANIIGVHAYNRQRRIGLILLLIVAAGLVASQAATLEPGKWREAGESILEMPVVYVLLSPFRWIVLTMTAEQLWPDLVQNAVLGLVVNGVMLMLILALDANYLEASAGASEKLYARIEKIRKGGMAAATWGSGKARFTLPEFPRLGGIGPLAWRQSLSALRNPWWLFTMVLVTVGFLFPFFLRDDSEKTEEIVIPFGIAMLVTVTMFAPMLITFDFRGDVDRFEVLKTFPVPTWRLVAGQLFAPVAVITVFEVVILVVMTLVLSLPWWIPPAGLLFFVPINFMLFAIENLFFLLFPTRQIAGGVADMQGFGRRILLWIAKVFCLTVVLSIAGGFGLLVYWLSGEMVVPAVVVAWLILTGWVCGLVPLLVLAFQRFDVSSDIPG